MATNWNSLKPIEAAPEHPTRTKDQKKKNGGGHRAKDGAPTVHLQHPLTHAGGAAPEEATQTEAAHASDQNRTAQKEEAPKEDGHAAEQKNGHSWRNLAGGGI